MSIKSINPATGLLNAEFERHSNTYVHAAIERANERYKVWRERTFTFRANHVLKLAEILKEDRHNYAELMTQEMGKVKAEALAEVDKCIWLCEYYAEQGEGFLKDESLSLDQGKAIISYEPLGVILGVMPWNFPFWQVFRFAIPTLLAGNTVLLKHASNVPQCAIALEELFTNAGFLPGVYQNLLIPSSEVEGVLTDDKVKGVSLTGSEWAGSSVASIAGKHIKPSLLELGGSDPFIVLEDADVAKTARIAAKSRMINCGQSCIAAKRFIVHSRVYDEFVRAFVAHMRTYVLGDPTETGVKCGPLVSETAAKEIHKQVSSAIADGANLLLGGKPSELGAAFYQPTVLTGITPSMSVFKEEVFGPVALITKVKDLDEAIDFANQSDFGLGASVWTNDLSRGKEVARQVESGAVFINKMVASSPYIPFGGIKKSGFGRELAHSGMRAFTNQKSIVWD